MSHDRTSAPTLDAERTGQLRTFLTVEAAADAATARPIRSHGRRRLVGGIAAAFLLGAGLFAANAIAGGPGPAQVGSANALSIETDGGWTTVRIEDIDADPQAVLDELHDAGIAAELDRLAVSSDGGAVSVGSGAGEAGVVGMVGSGHGDRGLVGLSVSLPAGAALPALPGPSSDEPQASTSDSRIEGGPSTQVSGGGPGSELGGDPGQLESLGVRFGADGSVSIRNDAGNRVIVYVQ